MADLRDQGADPREDKGPRRPRSRLRNLAVDITPLRIHRDYRYLWTGQLVSEAGKQITLVAVFYQIYSLTKSAAAVGLVGLVVLIPLMVTTIAGGSIVDAIDRRKLLLITQTGFACTTTVLLLGALSGHPPLWLVYGAVGVSAAFAGIESPTRSAITPIIVGMGDLPQVMALNQVMWNTTMIVGPALGGVVLARLGLSWAYGIDLASYAASIAAAVLIRPIPPAVEGSNSTRGLAAIKEGLTFLRSRRVIRYTFIIDLFAMVFGMPRALFPILAVKQFHSGPEVLGLLMAAPAAGALVASLTSGWVSKITSQGRAVVTSVAVWGAGITAFALVGPHLWFGLLLLAIAGAADVISAVFRWTMLQMSIPDSLRGRISAIGILVVMGGPRLGDFEAGTVAQVFSPFVSVFSGGLACLVGVGAIALFVPEFTRYRSASKAGQTN